MIQRIMIADYNQLLNTPIENKDLSSFSPKDASDNKIYHHLGATTEKLEHNGLYRSDGSNWIALDSTEELQKYQQKLTAGSGITIDENNVISASGITAGAVQVSTREQLPAVGDVGGVYFVLSEQATYCWDKETKSYKSMGQNYEHFIFNGGDALNE